MERIIVYEEQLRKKEEREAEIYKCLLENRKDAMPKPINNLIIEVDIMQHGIVIKVLNHSVLKIIRGYLFYGSDWDENQAMEVVNEALAISAKKEKYISKMNKPFIKAFNRINGQLIWSDNEPDADDVEKDVVSYTSPKVAIATIMTA